MPPVFRPAPGRVAAHRLDALLRDLGPRLRRGEVPGELPERCPTGLAAVDRALGGGFPRGCLAEIAGPASSGRTSLALGLLASATRSGALAAVVDGCDAFDPVSAGAAGVLLERVLWVRAPDRRVALRSTEHLLETGGFALVLLDLTEDLASPKGAQPRRAAGSPPRRCGAERRPIGTPSEVPRRHVWPRLVRAAAASRAALVVIASGRVAGTFAALGVELDPARARFSGTPPLLGGLEGRLLLVRNRLGPAHRRAAFRLSRDDEAA